MVSKTLFLSALVALAACGASSARQPASTAGEIVEATDAPTADKSFTKIDRPVRLTKLRAAGLVTNPPKKFAALLMLQDEELTSDDSLTTATLKYDGTNAAYQVDLERGMAYAVVSETGDVPNDPPSPPTATDMAIDPDGEDDATPADRPMVTDGSHPVVKVKSVGAGAEGTELFVAVLRLEKPNGDPSDDAQVVIFHMGGQPGSRVWGTTPNTTTTDPNDYDLKSIPFKQRDKVFLSVRINNYFKGTPDYKPVKRRRLAAFPEVKAIYDEVSAKRLKLGGNFFNVGN
jgi:hypothetical protein